MAIKTAANAALGIAQASPSVADVSPVCPVGTIAKMYDDARGEGEYIYLPVSVAVNEGDLVSYSLVPGSQSIAKATGLANTGRPVASALNTCAAGTYSWFQISGIAAVNAVAGAVAGNCYLSATAGQVQSTAIAGAQIINARIETAVGTPAAGQAYVQMHRPAMQTQIT